MYDLIYKKSALKALAKMPIPLAERFRQAFRRIASDQEHDYDIKPLSGRDGYRLRIGSWRAIYVVDNGRLKIVVITIGSRGDVYK